jgi:hypothetical protein
MASQSPLKAKPLRLPGESLDIEIESLVTDTAMGYVLAAMMFCFLAGMEWLAVLTRAPRRPVLFSVMAVAAVAVSTWRFIIIRKRVRQLRQGRDGERCVGQFLERLRESGAQVFHDIPGGSFNLDHVVISVHGIYAIETKTYSKPWSQATVSVNGDAILVAGHAPDRNPVLQVAAAARWLEGLIEQSTGKKFKVRGVVVFPGWYVEQRSPRGEVWVLEPKALPAFIEHERAQIAPADVSLAAYHLSRYVRTEIENAT